MPNNCSNRLTVSGPVIQLNQFMEKARNVTDENEVEPFCFDKLVPIPTELKGTDSPTDSDDKLAAERLVKFGASNWYDWCLQNWGTKWGSYDFADTEWDINNDTAVVEFMTAWCPGSEQFWVKVSSQFPELIFVQEYSEPGMCFVGSEEYKNGQQVSLIEPEWDSDEGTELRKTFGHVWEDEDEEETND